MTHKFTVRLNGTDENPFLKLGVTQNPFPQVACYEYARYLRHLANLGAEPIPNVEYIRKHLAGWSKEFVDLCCSKFVKGEMVEFTVQFDE